MPISANQLDMLMTSLHPDRVATRNQSGRQLSYVEGYDIKATLIRVFGFGGFSADVTHSQIVQVRENGNPSHVDSQGNAKTPQVLATATVRLTIFGMGPDGQDVTYTESAVGANSGWDIGDAADNAIKSAATDALKRCATYLGSQFGLSLYDGGRNYEVIRRLYAPGQAEMYEEVLASRAARQQAAQEAVQAQADRATGSA